jgi:hypothetical protein
MWTYWPPPGGGMIKWQDKKCNMGLAWMCICPCQLVNQSPIYYLIIYVTVLHIMLVGLGCCFRLLYTDACPWTEACLRWSSYLVFPHLFVTFLFCLLLIIRVLFSHKSLLQCSVFYRIILIVIAFCTICPCVLVKLLTLTSCEDQLDDNLIFGWESLTVNGEVLGSIPDATKFSA